MLPEETIIDPTESPKAWFGEKRLGFGIGPRRWHGWTLTAAFLALVYLDVHSVSGTLKVIGILVLGATYFGIIALQARLAARSP